MNITFETILAAFTVFAAGTVAFTGRSPGPLGRVALGIVAAGNGIALARRFGVVA